MANNRLSMREITETLRLHHECGRSNRDISRAIGALPTTVCDYLRRAKAAGLGYPLPDGMDNPALELRLFPPAVPSDVVRSEPDLGAGRTAKCAGRTSRWSCCGRNTERRIPRATNTAGSANAIGNGSASCRSPCGKRTRPARSCSSIMPGRPADH